MTATLPRPDLLPGPNRPRPRRPAWLVVALVVVILATGAVFVTQAARLRGAVARERTALENARAVEGVARHTLSRVRSETAAAVSARNRTAAIDAARTRDRDRAQKTLIRIEHGLASTAHQLTGTQAALALLAQYSAPRHICVAGVEAATSALRHDDPHAAVGALKAAGPSCSTALAAATGARFPYDFPDPSILRVGSRYYAYSTNSGAGNIQVLVSRDLVHWSIVGDGLATLPAWAAPDATWAPAVVAIGGHYVAYYTVRDLGSGLQCISVAVAAGPAGPFVDLSKAPFICQTGGSIDPSPFVDADGSLTLLWKSEAIPLAPTIIWSQPLSADGLKLTGVASQMLTPGQSWEAGHVEAPSMIRIAGRYYLFYSGNYWATAEYAEGVAVCAGPHGPCRRTLSGPALASQGRLAGPGGGSAFTTTDGHVMLAFAAFAQPAVGYPNSRTLHLATVKIVEGVPIVTPQ